MHSTSIHSVKKGGLLLAAFLTVGSGCTDDTSDYSHPYCKHIKVINCMNSPIFLCFPDQTPVKTLLCQRRQKFSPPAKISSRRCKPPRRTTRFFVTRSGRGSTSSQTCRCEVCHSYGRLWERNATAVYPHSKRKPRNTVRRGYSVPTALAMSLTFFHASVLFLKSNGTNSDIIPLVFMFFTRPNKPLCNLILLMLFRSLQYLILGTR